MKELVFGNKQRFCVALVVTLFAWTAFAAVCLVAGAFSALKTAGAVLMILLLLFVSAAIRYRDSRR